MERVPIARALFLDRDGVINVDHGYVHKIADFEFMPGIFELARFAHGELGWPLIVVSNQSGIGRGLFTEAAYQELTDWMMGQFAARGAPLAKVYHAPHHPEHGIGAYRVDHHWRKPRPGMLLQAAEDFGLDLPRSALVGNTMGDMEAAAAAGVGLRIRLDAQRSVARGPSHVVVASNVEAVDVMRQYVAGTCESEGAEDGAPR